MGNNESRQKPMNTFTIKQSTKDTSRTQSPVVQLTGRELAQGYSWSLENDREQQKVIVFITHSLVELETKSLFMRRL